MKFVKNTFMILALLLQANLSFASDLGQQKSPIERIASIMMCDTDHKVPYQLFKHRDPHHYQELYELVTQHPELMQGIILDGRTFAMLCVQRGYTDLLARLINENYSIDVAMPCYLYGLENPQTTVLHQLFGQFRSMTFSFLKDAFPKEYIADINDLIQLIISKYPELLDMNIDREPSARMRAWDWGVACSIPSK